MLATVVYAINPQTQTVIEGFTSFSPDAEAHLKRVKTLKRDVKSQAWTKWSGEWRKLFIARCITNGWDIHVKSAMLGDVE